MKKLRDMKDETVDWVRDHDDVVLPFYETLHGGSEVKQSSFIGGMFSIVVRAYVWYIIIVKGYQMLYL